MSNKTLNILAFVPLVNLFVIIYFVIKMMKMKKTGDMLITLLIWMGIMLGTTIFRAIVTVILSSLEMFMVINVVTYVSLYVSTVLGALICVRRLMKADDCGTGYASSFQNKSNN